MPKLWQRLDGCLIIKGIIHNQDEDNCTWQVDDARNTIKLLNAHGIDTTELPVQFPLALVVKLKRRRWISTRNNAGRKLKKSKQTTVRRKRQKTLAEKNEDYRVTREMAKLGFNREMLRAMPPEMKRAVKQLVAQGPSPRRGHDPTGVSVAKLARRLKVTPLQIMNEAGRRGYKTQSPSDSIPGTIATRIVDYFRLTRRSAARR